MVAPFHVDSGDRAAARIAGLVRRRLESRLPKGEAMMVRADSTEEPLLRAGFLPGASLGERELALLARHTRADEVVVGRVRRRDAQFEVEAALVLPRDWRRRQPFARYTAASAEAAADSLVRRLVGARTQLTGLRRCENNARTGRRAAAVAEAQQAIARYAPAALARLCLAEIMITNGTDIPAALRLATEVLAQDTASVIAATIKAQAHTALGHREASAAWARVLALRADSLELATTAAEELLRLDHAAAAAALPRVRGLHPDAAEPRRQHFRALYLVGAWAAAAPLGDSLDAGDDLFRDDPAMTRRLVDAHLQSGDTITAVARAATGIRRHPSDDQLYGRYAELIEIERARAIPRGLGLFPASDILRLLQARVARASGNSADEKAALAAVLTLQPQDVPVALRLSELWWSEGQPDSALQVLGRAPRAGDHTDLLRATALGRGQTLLRTMSAATPARAIQLAVAFVGLADSVRSAPDSRALLVAGLLHSATRRLSLAAETRACPAAREGGAELSWADSLLRVPANGAAEVALDELIEAHRRLQEYATQALAQWCTEPATIPPPTDPSGTARQHAAAPTQEGRPTRGRPPHPSHLPSAVTAPR